MPHFSPAAGPRLSPHADLALTLRELHGPAGPTWWMSTMSERLLDVEALWSARFTEKLPSGPHAYLLAGTAPPDQSLVLKLPAHPDFGLTEAAAYAYWSEVAAFPRLFDADPATGALLLERVPARPAAPDIALELPAAALTLLHRTPFSSASRAATHSTARLFARLSPVGLSLARLANAARSRARASLDFDDVAPSLARIDDALDAGLSLATSYRGQRFLVHGDFTPDNLLFNGDDTYWVINPRPVISEPSFDIASWAVAASHPLSDSITTLCAALDLETDRAFAWADVLSVLMPPIHHRPPLVPAGDLPL